MISRLLAVVLATMLIAAPSSAQLVDGWVAHTSFGEATDLVVAGDEVWVATTGGVYWVNPALGEISRLTVVDGLSNVGASALDDDPSRGYLWVGYDDGLLDRIDRSSGTIRTYRDIERADQYPSKGINRLLVVGDSVFVATQFGVVVFDPERNEVRDSFDRFGTMTVGQEVHDVLVESVVLGEPAIWIATDDGIAVSLLDGRNLKDPASWQTENLGTTFRPRPALSLGVLDGRMHIGTDIGIFERVSSGQFTDLGVTNRPVTRLESGPGFLAASATFTLAFVRSNGETSAHSITNFGFPVAVDVAANGDVWVADEANGSGNASVPAPDAGAISLKGVWLPEGPADGTFSQISISGEGDVWLAGVNEAGTGFYRLDTQGTWTTWSSALTPELAGKGAFVQIHAGLSGFGWAGSEGGGVAQVEADGSVTLYGPANSSLLPASGSVDFVVVGGVHEDRLGNLWVTTRASSRPLHVRSATGDWTAFGPKIGQGLLSSATAYGRIFVDSFDQKWIVIHRETNFQQKKGLMVLETGVPENPTDDEFRYFDDRGAAGQGLPAVSVNVIAEDQDGLVWIGTDSGPAFFINTGIVARDNSAIPIWPQWADRSRGTFMLFGLTVNDIAVDPAGRIWFATNDGAWLIEAAEGGFDLVQHFTAENSPLFSNEVLSVDVSESTGEVFFSTDRGLISYASDAIAPSQQAGELIVFPNPIRISDLANPSVFVEGLVAATDIRIVTVAGNLVRWIQARGGRTRWDLRDEEGRLVESGVYLIVAVGQNDEGSSVGKVVVVR
jgi:ligand-binding sensor domain-containing protein